MRIKDGVLSRITEEDIIDGKLIIPEGVIKINDGSKFGHSVIWDAELLKEVVFTQPVEIGKGAFAGCKNLTQITIPKGVVSIGENAFSGCESLTSIVIPEGVTSIGSHAFSGCASLKTITIPEGVTNIGSNAFYRCSSLENVNIPESVTEIGVEAFNECGKITEMVIPEATTRIGCYAFKNCTNLAKINIPKGIKDAYKGVATSCFFNDEDIGLPEGIFIGCTSLQSVEIPQEVTRIRGSAFEGCASLASIDIPESVKYIGSGAFKHCVNLTSIDVPEGVTFIANMAFEGCNNLQSVKIPPIIQCIDPSAFKGCTNLTNIYGLEGIERYIGREAFAGCSSLTGIELSGGLTKIGQRAFKGCTHIESIAIPDTVTEIANCKFKDLSDLSEEQLESVYEAVPQGDKVKKAMFGEYLERINAIKAKANFHLGPEYDAIQMMLFYRKMIKSIGIDEIEKMVEMPELTQKQIRRYQLEKDEQFAQLYETKYKIQGDIGVALELFKHLNFRNQKAAQNERITPEMKIFKQINYLLEEGNVSGLEELVAQAMQNAGFEATESELEQIRRLEHTINGRLIKNNLAQISGKLENILSMTNEQFGEPIVPAQLEPVRLMVEDVMTDIFKNNSGRVDKAELKAKLNVKLSNAGAPYIREKREEIVSRIITLLEDEDARKATNHSALEALKSAKKQIGGEWKYKLNQAAQILGYTLESLPNELTQEQIEKMQVFLGTETNPMTMETGSISVLKEGESREAAFKLLEERGLPEVVTYKQIHDMFGNVNEPYSEEFRKYFKKHRKEFLTNPRYIQAFGRIHNGFTRAISSSELRNIWEKNGDLEISQIQGYLETLEFANQREGNERLAKLSTTVGEINTEEEFEYVQNIYDIVKRRERSSIPPVKVSAEKFRGRMLSPDDVLNMFAGNITTCCQKFNDVGEGAMLLGSIEENAGIFVIEEVGTDGEAKIIGQSLVIRQKGVNGTNDRLTFDNIEISNPVYKRLTTDEHQEILGIYRQAAIQAIEKDKKFLGELFKSGKITQEQYDTLVLKEVIAGTGFNDLKGLTDLPKTVPVAPDEGSYRYTNMAGQKIYPWIDSAAGLTPSGSEGVPVILATMDKEEQKAISDRQSGSGLVKKAALSDVPLWYGKVGEVQRFDEKNLSSEWIKKIRALERKAYRAEHQILNTNNVETAEDIQDEYGIENMKVAIGSNEDWYLIYGEDEDGNIAIQDLAIVGAIHSNKNGANLAANGNSKLATLEAADMLYEVLIQAGEQGKDVICNATKDTSLVNIKRMLRKGLVKAYDLDGEEIVWNIESGMVYEETGEEVSYRKHDRQGKIKLLDLRLEPDVAKIMEERKRTQELLKRISELKGKAKEEGLDELRRTIREDLEDNER